jgi:hypothetical protein
VEAQVSVLQMQQLGSMASRYSEICQVMRPYTKAIWRPLVGRTNTHSKFLLPTPTKRAIWMWRMTLVLLRGNRLSLSRSFKSFVRQQEADFLFVSDASLTGHGGQIFDLRSGTAVLLGVSRERFPSEFNFDESSYQNLAEFLGIVTLLLALVAAGTRGASIILRGDSKTALKWAKSQSYSRADRNNNTSLLFTMLMLEFDLQIHSTEFIKSKDNDLCDALSRDLPMDAYGEVYKDVRSYYSWPRGGTVDKAIKLCNPRNTDDGSVDYVLDNWLQFREVIQGIKDHPAAHPHPIKTRC